MKLVLRIFCQNGSSFPMTLVSHNNNGSKSAAVSQMSPRRKEDQLLANCTTEKYAFFVLRKSPCHCRPEHFKTQLSLTFPQTAACNISTLQVESKFYSRLTMNNITTSSCVRPWTRHQDPDTLSLAIHR